MQLSDILTGFLLHELQPKPTITRLPAAELPRPVRSMDPNLQFAPIQRLDIGDYFISLGDRNIVISCKLPYQKWPKFKQKILDIISLVQKAGINNQVDRYSIKYINLIQAPTNTEQIQKIRMDIKLGDVEVNDEHISLRVQNKDADILHIMSVITGAQAQLHDGTQRSGTIVDIDSIKEVNGLDFPTFVESLNSNVETLRQKNKIKFFSCLTTKAIEEMEPSYE
jgi:uncharacterized protein (TIGR04255 family)